MNGACFTPVFFGGCSGGATTGGSGAIGISKGGAGGLNTGGEGTPPEQAKVPFLQL